MFDPHWKILILFPVFFSVDSSQDLEKNTCSSRNARKET
jgi:hypothetical protein